MAVKKRKGIIAKNIYSRWRRRVANRLKINSVLSSRSTAQSG